MKQLLTTYVRLTRATCARIEALLAREFSATPSELCTVEFVSARSLRVSAKDEKRQPFCVAFVNGVLATREPMDSAKV